MAILPYFSVLNCFYCLVLFTCRIFFQLLFCLFAKVSWHLYLYGCILVAILGRILDRRLHQRLYTIEAICITIIYVQFFRHIVDIGHCPSCEICFLKTAIHQIVSICICGCLYRSGLSTACQCCYHSYCHNYSQ